jgi:alpha-glucosidase
VDIDGRTGLFTAFRGEIPVFEMDLKSAGTRRADATFEMEFGMFNIEEFPEGPYKHALRAEFPRGVQDDRLPLLLYGSDQLVFEGEVAALGPRHLRLRLIPPAGDAEANRAQLSFLCATTDHFAGLGAQTHDVDHRGQIVPLWVSEQGVGKRDDDQLPQFWQIQGRRHTTHIPIPAFVTSRGTAVAVETPTYALFDFCASQKDEVRLEVWEGAFILHLFVGDDPLHALSLLSDFVGRPQRPPPFAFAPWNDAIFGTENVRAFAHFLRDNEIPSSAIWSEDWRGGEHSGDLYRLEEDWRHDAELYPDYLALNTELDGLGIAPLVYFNTFVTEGADIFDEVVGSNYAIGDVGGGPHLFSGVNAGFSPTALLDLTNPLAVKFMKREMEKAIALGARGWMADYAEWMPVDGAVLYSGEDPEQVHNRYPVLWQKLNREVMEEADRSEGMAVFVRSGHLFSQGEAQIVWAGDQRTSFQADDGLPTIVPIGLGLSATGFFFYAHDIAGYQSSTNEPASKELFFRWTELGAFSPVMRTHHGTHHDFNWNLQSDAETTAHWKRYAELHIQLFPYLYGLAKMATEKGRPLWIPMGLLHPEDPFAWEKKDQFYLGDAMLVAPVLTEGATAREVYFPEGRFVELFQGERTVKGPVTAEVDAPLGEIPVFLKAGGIVPLTKEPAQTLFKNRPGIPGLETTEGDRLVYVALGADGQFTEDSGASYTLSGSGTSLKGLDLQSDGSLHLLGNGKVKGDGFTLKLEGHPGERVTRVFFR